MKLSLRNNSTLLCIALSSLLFRPALSLASEDTSYAQEIRQYVDEDKVYLLENIRQKVTRPSEKMVIEALLSEDGPQAVNLYRKQLREYPDPAIDKLSSSRLEAYDLVLGQHSSRPKPLPKAAPVPPDTTTHTPLLPAAVKPVAPASQDTSLKAAALPASKKTATKPAGGITRDTTKKEASIRIKAAKPAEAAPKKEKRAPEAGSFLLQAGSFSSRENADAFVAKISGSAPAEVVKDGAAYKVRLKKSYLSKKEAEEAGRALPFKAIAVPAR